MKRGTPLTTTAALAALLALAGAASAPAAAAAAMPESAQRLPDPTRPAAAALLAPVGAGAAAAEPLPQLQSVMLGAAGGYRLAVIDGQSVRVGESFRGARVVRIADNEVELQRGRERQVLHLYAPDAPGGVTRVPASAARRTGARQ